MRPNGWRLKKPKIDHQMQPNRTESVLLLPDGQVMDFQILVSNLTNPTPLFFLFGVVAALEKSDLEIPLALLFSLI